jgi:hypothetical protein
VFASSEGEWENVAGERRDEAGEGKEGRARIFHGRLVEPPLGHISLTLSSHFPSVAAGSLDRV